MDDGYSGRDFAVEGAEGRAATGHSDGHGIGDALAVEIGQLTLSAAMRSTMRIEKTLTLLTLLCGLGAFAFMGVALLLEDGFWLWKIPGLVFVAFATLFAMLPGLLVRFLTHLALWPGFRRRLTQSFHAAALETHGAPFAVTGVASQQTCEATVIHGLHAAARRLEFCGEPTQWRIVSVPFERIRSVETVTKTTTNGKWDKGFFQDTYKSTSTHDITLHVVYVSPAGAPASHNIPFRQEGDAAARWRSMLV